MAQTFHVGDYLSESETQHLDMQLDVELFSVPGTEATGHRRRDADQELEGQCDEVGTAGVMADHVYQHGVP